jgi:hypothetical protein
LRIGREAHERKGIEMQDDIAQAIYEEELAEKYADESSIK